MKLRNALTQAVAISASASSTMAQIVQYDPPDLSGVSYKVNLPSATAQSGSGPIYFQIQGPTSLRWLGMGIGTGMTGAEIFVMYAASETNVTISPRLGFGHFEPTPDPAARVTLLEGSGIENNVMTGNFRCDNCVTWSDGSADLKSTSTSMLSAGLHGPPINSADPSALITLHDTASLWSIDFVQATGGNSENPFIDSSSFTIFFASGNLSLTPLEKQIMTHGIIMCLVFLILVPSFALTVYLFPFTKVVPLVHGPLQVLTILLAVAGLGQGVSLAMSSTGFNGVHQIIGLFIISSLAAFQPLMGLLQHLHWRKYSKRSRWWYTHRWFGRCSIILGMINGGLGFWLAGPGTPQAPWGAIISYSVIAGVMAIFYVSVLGFKEWKAHRRSLQTKNERPVGQIEQPAGK